MLCSSADSLCEASAGLQLMQAPMCYCRLGKLACCIYRHRVAAPAGELRDAKQTY